VTVAILTDLNPKISAGDFTASIYSRENSAPTTGSTGTRMLTISLDLYFLFERRRAYVRRSKISKKPGKRQRLRWSLKLRVNQRVQIIA
jgi:hypothetical protein